MNKNIGCVTLSLLTIGLSVCRSKNVYTGYDSEKHNSNSSETNCNYVKHSEEKASATTLKQLKAVKTNYLDCLIYV